MATREGLKQNKTKQQQQQQQQQRRRKKPTKKPGITPVFKKGMMQQKAQSALS